jgi:hypothetical protein
VTGVLTAKARHARESCGRRSPVALQPEASSCRRNQSAASNSQRANEAARRLVRLLARGAARDAIAPTVSRPSESVAARPDVVAQND